MLQITVADRNHYSNESKKFYKPYTSKNHAAAQNRTGRTPTIEGFQHALSSVIRYKPPSLRSFR